MNDVTEALEYLKGYCNKHPSCEGRNDCHCRLYNPLTKACFLYESPIPSDWVIKDDEEEVEG